MRKEEFEMSKVIRKFDERSNMIYFENPEENFWQKTKYDSNDRIVYSENSKGEWKRIVYSKSGEIVYYATPTFEKWFEEV